MKEADHAQGHQKTRQLPVRRHVADNNCQFTGGCQCRTHEEEYVDTPGSGEMIIDAVVVRPIMLVGTVVGVVLFVVTLPFSALGGNVGEAADKLVVEPAAYTFVRPLGEM